jgi:hypothetical protein
MNASILRHCSLVCLARLDGGLEAAKGLESRESVVTITSYTAQSHKPPHALTTAPTTRDSAACA